MRGRKRYFVVDGSNYQKGLVAQLLSVMQHIALLYFFIPCLALRDRLAIL